MTDQPEVTPTGDDLDAALREASEGAISSTRSHALTDEEASRLAASSRPTVIVFAGGVKAGKTTLITSLYERFSRGPIGAASFGGSLTLPGFEARARGLRPQIGTKLPMPHTHRDAVPWLHLRIAIQPDVLNLLFGDFDGEIFDGIVEGKENARTVPALRRADHLVIVVDGSQLASAVARPHASQRAHDLIDIVTDTDVAAAPSALSIVLTKLDLLNMADVEQAEAARDALDAIRTHLGERIGASPPVIETAAISEDPSLPLAHGAEELLSYWHRHSVTGVATEPLVIPIDQGTWFGRFDQ